MSLLPAAAYQTDIGSLGYSRRSIIVVNKPEYIRGVTTEALDLYPKNDLMVGALRPLVGDSIFVSSGDVWRRQRRMIDPAFSQMRINRAFASMTAAVDDYEAHLIGVAERGETFSLDLAMSHLTADVICRTVFSTSLQTQAAHDVFNAFSFFERTVAHVELRRLIFEKAWTKVPHQPEVLEACQLIRQRLGELLDTHLEAGGKDFNDITSTLIGARDSETDAAFSREELIDQLGVFFLAGHETTASVLTWVFFILAVHSEMRQRLRAEIDDVVGDGPVTFEHTKRLALVRNVFREALRLYPPLTFIPRVALENTRIGNRRIKRGAMIMLSPWVLHRHRKYWRDPNAFDPDRFSAEREDDIVPGTYMPFGQGPRICIGAGFATTESTLLIARLVRSFDFEPLDTSGVRPVARLTTRPEHQVMCRVRRHNQSDD
ncbi:MAG: cytochrome P450 [Pseudomonadota bacterium]